MRRLVVLFLLASCASPFPLISTKGTTIENARKLLNGYEVKVTRYTNENAEAWYFNKNECVLFIDGTLRYTTYTVKSVNGEPLPTEKQPQVLCRPSDVLAEEHREAKRSSDAGTTE